MHLLCFDGHLSKKELEPSWRVLRVIFKMWSPLSLTWASQISLGQACMQNRGVLGWWTRLGESYLAWASNIPLVWRYLLTWASGTHLDEFYCHRSEVKDEENCRNITWKFRDSKFEGDREKQGWSYRDWPQSDCKFHPLSFHLLILYSLPWVASFSVGLYVIFIPWCIYFDILYIWMFSSHYWWIHFVLNAWFYLITSFMKLDFKLD